MNEAAAVMELDEDFLDRTGLTNLADMLQRLPISSSAVNTRFNVPGNSGFPQDGTGIGAGAARIALRNLGARRTLVLVDGRRFVPGASASGVPIAVDLNTIPTSMIERIDILQDGASAIYGSDAIGGVVNVITHRCFEGFAFGANYGGFVDEEDGENTSSPRAGAAATVVRTSSRASVMSKKRTCSPPIERSLRSRIHSLAVATCQVPTAPRSPPKAGSYWARTLRGPPASR